MLNIEIEIKVALSIWVQERRWLSPGCFICPHYFRVFIAAACRQFFSLGRHKDWMHQHTKNVLVSQMQAHINQAPRDRCLMPEFKGGSAIFSL